MRIKTENLTYIYSEKSKDLAVRALDDVSLTVEEGEFFGIIGHTGSGKSTFVQHLNGLIRVGKGKGVVKVGEFDLTDKKCDMKALRAKVGMVFQYPEYQLFAETVSEDVKFGLKNFYPSIGEKAAEAEAARAVNLVGLDYEAIKNKSPFELSGGQKRRVAIAGVIVSKPEVLVLDEPAAGLDPKGKREFISLLHELHKDAVKTIIIVSHDMNLVAENCTRAAIFSEGRLYKVGVPKDIFADMPELAKLGLDMPDTAFITSELKKAGINADNDFTEEGFLSAVVKCFKDSNGGEL